MSLRCPVSVCDHLFESHNFFDCTGCDEQSAWISCDDCDTDFCRACECGGEPLEENTDNSLSSVKNPSARRRICKDFLGGNGSQSKAVPAQHVEQQEGR